MSLWGQAFVNFFVELRVVELTKTFIFLPIPVHDDCIRAFIRRFNDYILPLGANERLRVRLSRFVKLLRTLYGWSGVKGRTIRNCPPTTI